MKWHWQLIVQNCTGCGICRDVCNENAIKMSKAMAYPEPIKGNCIGCLDCVNECPFEAIEVSQLNISAPQYDKKNAPNAFDML